MNKMNNSNEIYPIAENFKRNPNLKPEAKLLGVNGNIFNLLGICKRSLRKSSPNAFNELLERVENSKSYDEALAIIMEYVEVI